MTGPSEGWSLDEISPEARRAAEKAAAAAGMPLDEWLNQFIKYVSTMELRDQDQDASSEITKSAIRISGVATDRRKPRWSS